MLEEVDEKQKSSFWYGFATNYVFSMDKNEVLTISADDSLFLKQARVIEELYEKESAVIIGRCSDFILKDKKNVLSIFIYSSDVEFKIKRKTELENLSKKEATKKIKKMDKQRSDYYEHFTSKKWGDKSNYDICIDTSKIGVDQTIDILECYFKEKIK